MHEARKFLKWMYPFAGWIRGFLCWIYALTAAIFLQHSLSTVQDVFGSLFVLRVALELYSWRDIANALGPLTLPAVGIVFAMAWWTVWRRRPSSRGWAIAASIIYLLLSLMGFYLGGRVLLWPMSLPLLAMGIGGLVVFAPGKLAAKLAEKPSALRSIPGDGTNALVNGLIVPAGIVANFAASTICLRWANDHGLQQSHDLAYYLYLAPALLLIVAIHEGGHAIAGWAFKMKLSTFVIGPLCWSNQYGKWHFKFRPANIFAVFNGMTAVIPTTLENFRRQKVLQVAAGPLANLCTGLVAIGVLLATPKQIWIFEMVSSFAILSLLVFALNLIPFKIGCIYSDGAKIYQLLSKGLWGDYHRALAVVSSTTVTHLRAKDYDIETLQRAAGHIALGEEELLMHLRVYAHYLDSSLLPEASQALAKAERLYDEASPAIPAQWHLVFVYGKALVQRDAAGARVWWERFEAAKESRTDHDPWTSYSALLWSEGRQKEAEEAWEMARDWAWRLPNVGNSEGERNAVNLLRRALDESASVRLSNEQPAING